MQAVRQGELESFLLKQFLEPHVEARESGGCHRAHLVQNGTGGGG